MLTEDQAYAAMYYFLDQIWSRVNTMELVDVLSDMTLLPDGTLADPAVSEEWKEAVDYALNGGKAGVLELGPSSH
jgi:hypothetical protein